MHFATHRNLYHKKQYSKKCSEKKRNEQTSLKWWGKYPQFGTKTNYFLMKASLKKWKAGKGLASQGGK